ncbi:hypothetical protein NP233_g10918 [Leucocoprinus birnbaumii]|uniref:Phosphodiesterase n=1 Tax=Leucocoprinus birnbaumii TaxID=56174 RepID=A0AAD5YKW2_9AGAR|nr:hypothetical protein NP233_g10918 [Leucocoprinus birnbaumii]
MSQPTSQSPAADSHSHSHNHPPMVVSEAVLRRRSADVGGLHLAMRGESQGQGWLDSTGPDTNITTEYAELCAQMYRETLRLVENNVAQNDLPILTQADRKRLLQCLESWYFEPLRMPEHELLACVLFLFQVLFRIEGMREAVNVDFVHIRQLYRWQNHYHNFEHAVDVLQAIHCYLRAAGMVPSVSLLLTDADAPGGMWKSAREHDSGPLATCLTPHEIFALYLAAIGHDVGHPGFNNPFMKNADTPLSQVYDNQSALEQMHSYMLFMAMRQYGLGSLLDDPKSGFLFRKILKSSVLATDMGVHTAFMEQFKQILDETTEASNGVVNWHTQKSTRQAFICQLLLKNADISNPCRPFHVSKQWASALQQEWACQYKFENFLELQHSVMPSNGPLAEAKSQVFFSKQMAKPLVDMTTIAIPELKQYSYHCAENLREWERILKELEKAPTIDSESTTPSTSDSSTNPSSSASSSSPKRPTVSPSGSPTRPEFNTSSTATPNITPHHAGGLASPPPSYISPIPMSTTSISTSSSISSTSSSSNPVSPRVTNSKNDYSNAFRLALPRAASSMSLHHSYVTASGSALSFAGSAGGRSRFSRTASSGGGVSPGGSSAGVLSPSLSRAATRVVSAGADHSSSALGGSPFSSSNSPSPPHLSSISLPRSPPLGGLADRTHMEGFRFPPPFSPTSSSMPPVPPPTAADPTAYFQSHSSTPSVSPSDSPSQMPDNDNADDVAIGDNSTLEANGGMMEDEYELDYLAHRANFHHVLGLGLGMGSLKKKKSRSVLKSSPLGYSPSPPPLPTSISGSPSTGGVGGRFAAASPPSSTSTASANAAGAFGVSSPLPLPPSGKSIQALAEQKHNSNRASWCPGESWDFDKLEHQIRSKEEARGAIEGWTRGRWGSASFGVPLASSSDRQEIEADGIRDDVDGETGEEVRSLPTGLVSAAPFSRALTPSLHEPDPTTPPQQSGTLDNRSSSPTPKADKQPLFAPPQEKPRETEAQRRKRMEKERQKIISELIRDEEKEKKKVMKKAVSMNFLNIGGSGGGASGANKDGRSRSRSRKKGKARK